MQAASANVSAFARLASTSGNAPRSYYLSGVSIGWPHELSDPPHRPLGAASVRTLVDGTNRVATWLSGDPGRAAADGDPGTRRHTCPGRIIDRYCLCAGRDVRPAGRGLGRSRAAANDADRLSACPGCDDDLRSCRRVAGGPP